MPEAVGSFSPEDVSRSSVAHDRYKTLFERVNASAFLADLSGRILEANHRSSEFLGYEWGELPRLSLQDVLPPETDWMGIRDELAARGGLNVETECVCKDGSRRPVEVSLSVFRMEARIVMFVLLWDIQVRRTAEQRLKESEKKYRGLFEYATDGIVVLDAHGDIVDVNTRVCELLDIAKQDLLAKNLFSMELLTARSMPIVVSEFEQLLSEKRAACYTTEIQTTRKQVLEVEISSFFLVKADNEVDNFVLIIRDITARNEAERTRAREHELFRTLLDNVPDSVYFKDAEHRFILVNKAKAEHARVRPDQMVGKTDIDFLPAEVAARLREDDQRVLLSGVPIVNKIEQIVDSFGERWVMVTKIPRYSVDGEVIGTMGISRDITSWRQAELELERSQGLLRLLLDALPDLVAVKDAARGLVVVNAAMAEWVHLPMEQLLGRREYGFLGSAQAAKVAGEEQLVLSAGVPRTTQVEFMGGDGRLHRFSQVLLPWVNAEQKLVGTMLLLRAMP